MSSTVFNLHSDWLLQIFRITALDTNIHNNLARSSSIKYMQYIHIQGHTHSTTHTLTNAMMLFFQNKSPYIVTGAYTIVDAIFKIKVLKGSQQWLMAVLCSADFNWTELKCIEIDCGSFDFRQKTVLQIFFNSLKSDHYFVLNSN